MYMPDYNKRLKKLIDDFSTGGNRRDFADGVTSLLQEQFDHILSRLSDVEYELANIRQDKLDSEPHNRWECS